MPEGAKYNFAVVCSADRDPNVTYKLQRNRHFLPNRELCKYVEIWADLTILSLICGMQFLIR